MAGYQHGVYTYEVPTSIVPPVKSTAGLTVIVGTAPIHLTDDPAALVNKPMLGYTYSECVKKMGYLDDFDSYTICEAISSHFALFAVAPIVMINVLDPDKHSETGSEKVTITKNEGILKVTGVLKSTVVIKDKDGDNPYDAKDYELEFDDDGYLHIYTSVATEVKVEFKKLNPSLVMPADIIGGVSLDGFQSTLSM